MSPSTLDDLGLPGSLYLWSLLHAQQHRLPIAPTIECIFDVLEVLDEQQIIALSPAPPGRGDKTTPLEGIPWRWAWTAYAIDGALEATEEYLASLPRDEQALELALVLWRRLVVAESQAFYAQQLVRCQFDAQWQQDMCFAQRSSGVSLTVAQWRYCGWAAVRHGATLVCQRSLPATEVRESMYKEMVRRACALASGRYGGCALPPHVDRPNTALGRALASQWFTLGASYWNELPNAQALRTPRSHAMRL